jgi:hypothetical protein
MPQRCFKRSVAAGGIESRISEEIFRTAHPASSYHGKVAREDSALLVDPTVGPDAYTTGNIARV